MIQNMGYTNGTYEYEYYPGSSNSSINHTQPLYESVIIENLRWDFRLEGKKMSLSLAHVDGSTLFFDSWK